MAAIEHNNAVCVPLALMKPGKEISLQNVIQYIHNPIPILNIRLVQTISSVMIK